MKTQTVSGEGCGKKIFCDLLEKPGIRSGIEIQKATDEEDKEDGGNQEEKSFFQGKGSRKEFLSVYDGKKGFMRKTGMGRIHLFSFKIMKLYMYNFK